VKAKDAGMGAGWPLLAIALVERIFEYISSSGKQANWETIAMACQNNQQALIQKIVEGITQ
jgi:hypothetical protein